MAAAAAAATNSQKLTMNGVLKSLTETGKYAYPSDLEGFYLMAKEMENHISNSDLLESYIANLDHKKKLEKALPAKGNVKSQKTFSPQELKKIVEDLIKIKMNSNLFFMAFKRLISYYFEGLRVLTESQKNQLYEKISNISRPKPKFNTWMSFINGLPEKSICAIAHLIFLGKLYVQTNKLYAKSPNHDEALQSCYQSITSMIYSLEKTIQKLIMTTWKEELGFSPNLSATGELTYGIPASASTVTISSILNYLKENKEYPHTVGVNGFYQLAKKVQNCIAVEGVFRLEVNVGLEEIKDKEMRNMWKKYEIEDKKHKSYSPEQLNINITELMKITANAGALSGLLKRVAYHCFEGDSVLNDKQYEELEAIHKKFPEPRAKAEEMMKFINYELTDESLCIMAHLLFLGKWYVQTNESYTNDATRNNAVNGFFSLIGRIIYSMSPEKQVQYFNNSDPEVRNSLKTLQPMRQFVFGVWRYELEYTPNVTGA